MSISAVETLTRLVRDVPDFPKPGILFKDISPLLGNPAAFDLVIEELARALEPLNCDHIVGIESRGFLVGAPLALRLGRGFVPVRKAGKLPAACWRIEYALEYGTDTLEIHQDAFAPGARIVIVDDLLATGGTAEATRRLIETAGGNPIAAAFLIELDGLGGRNRLVDLPITALLRF